VDSQFALPVSFTFVFRIFPAPNFRAELLLQFACNGEQCRPVLRIGLFHECGEFEHIALCTAAEALENSFFQIGRERRRIAFAVVIRQGAEAVMLRSFGFHLDAVVFEHLREVQLLAERLEVYPVLFHSIILR